MKFPHSLIRLFISSLIHSYFQWSLWTINGWMYGRTDGRTPNSMWCRMPGTRVLPQVFSFNYTILLITTRCPPMGPKQQAVGICHFDKTWAWARAKERATALEENDSEWASHHGSHHLVGTGVSWLWACVFVSIHQTERGDKQMRKSFFLAFFHFLTVPINPAQMPPQHLIVH